MPRGKLKEADFTKIRINYKMLLDELDAHFLVNELFSEGVLEIDDKQEIDGEHTRRKRTDILLQRILYSGPGDSFEIFVKVLKINYPHVAEKLTQQDRPGLDHSTSVPADETEADSSRPASGTSARSDVSAVSSSLILKCKTNCPKKPTHEYFIPFPTFKECRPDDIPPEIYKYLVNLGKQTVRVLTKYISPDRPDGYPLYERKGSNGKATGSGRIYRVLRKFSEKDGKTCPCQDCLRSSKPKKQWGEFMVITTKKVVYNDEECAQSYCLFGYDSPDMRGTCPELRGVRIITEDISTDVCEIVSITHDNEASLEIEELCRKNSELSSKISDKCYSKPDEPAPNLAVVISHPHGLSKHVTIGYCVEHDPTEVGQAPSVTYTADACSGSHGGPVFLLNSRMACCTSHRETTQIGLNFGTGVLWSL